MHVSVAIFAEDVVEFTKKIWWVNQLGPSTKYVRTKGGGGGPKIGQFCRQTVLEMRKNRGVSNNQNFFGRT